MRDKNYYLKSFGCIILKLGVSCMNALYKRVYVTLISIASEYCNETSRSNVNALASLHEDIMICTSEVIMDIVSVKWISFTVIKSMYFVRKSIEILNL